MCGVKIKFVLMFLLSLGVSFGETSGGIVSYKFTKKPTCVLDSFEYRLAPTKWTGLSSPLACSRKVVLSDPHTKAFFFEQRSGLCTPLVFNHNGSGDVSPEVPTGDLYFTTELVGCPQPFQAVFYGSSSLVTCITKITPPTTYDLATSLCVSLGGWLVTAKTSEKLDLVYKFANGTGLWVGLDDLAEEGRHVWQQDGSELTNDVLEEVFAPNEPNGYWEKEDCCIFYAYNKKLFDYVCDPPAEALCETPPNEPTC